VRLILEFFSKLRASSKKFRAIDEGSESAVAVYSTICLKYSIVVRARNCALIGYRCISYRSKSKYSRVQ
jgi:hypothetical protein